MGVWGIRNETGGKISGELYLSLIMLIDEVAGFQLMQIYAKKEQTTMKPKFYEYEYRSTAEPDRNINICKIRSQF